VIKIDAFPNPTNQSLFNSGIAKLERIDVQKRIIHAARLQHSWEAYADALCNIRNEINERLEADELTEADQKENEVMEEIKSYNMQKTRGKTVTINVKVLTDYDRFLSSKEYKYGMSLPNKEDWGEKDFIKQ